MDICIINNHLLLSLSPHYKYKIQQCGRTTPFLVATAWKRHRIVGQKKVALSQYIEADPIARSLSVKSRELQCTFQE